MPDTISPQDHIKKVGNAAYARAFVYARVAVRQDDHLIGLDKIREAIAREAALRATGYPHRPFILPRNAGRADPGIQLIAEQALARATAYARYATRNHETAVRDHRA